MTVPIRWLAALLLISAAQTAPGDQTDRIRSEQREALVALYNATGGPTWVHQDGWLGPPGTECHWYGVLCGKEWKGPLAGNLSVQVLELPNNGLTGRVPPEIGGLKGLRRLILRGNPIKPPLPDSLLQRIDAGHLEIEPSSLIHDVEEVVFDFNNPSMLCSGYRARIAADGRVHLERRLCREDPKQSVNLRCELRDGKTFDFDMLGRFLIRTGFFSEPEDSTTLKGSDVGQLTVTAKRRSAASVTRAWSGSSSLSDWSLSVMLEGIVYRTRWSTPPTESACSVPVPVAPPSGVSP
jgi:hypothetical protein